MKPKHRRLLMVVVMVIGLSVSATLILSALRDNMMFFYTPSEVLEKKVQPGTYFRLGGLVQKGTVSSVPNTPTIRFVIADQVHHFSVTYTGIPPDLFREGQGIIAIGTLNNDHVFEADTILAKHDENYRPAYKVSQTP